MPRKKQQRLLYDATFTHEDTAVLLFKTSYESYEFVWQFNNAYSLEVARVDDLEIGGTHYSCFCHNDECARLVYVVIGCPKSGSQDAVFGYYDQMVLVRGVKAWEFQRDVYEEVAENGTEPPACEYAAHRRWVLSNEFRQKMFSVDWFDFRSGGIVSSILKGQSDEIPSSVALSHRRIRTFLDKVFDVLQWHLCED